MRRCKSRYSPELKTISETATMAVSNKQASPLDDVQPAPSESRAQRSHSTPPPKSLRATQRQESHRNRAQTTDTPASPSKKHTHHAKNKYQRTVLHNAVRKGDKQEVKRLVQEQPELLRHVDSRGNLPLHYAASPNVPDGPTIVYMLLKAGAPVNALNDRRQTALIINVISSEDDNDLVPRILLYHNAKPAIKVTQDLMLAPYASSRGLHKVAAAIREYM